MQLLETKRYLPPSELVDLKPYALAGRKSHVGVWRAVANNFLVWDEDKQRTTAEYHWDSDQVPGHLGNAEGRGSAKPLWVIGGTFAGDAESVLRQALAALSRDEFFRQARERQGLRSD